MGCNRTCPRCGVPLDCDHPIDICWMCIGAGDECIPWEEPDLQDVDEDEQIKPDVEYVRG